MRFGAARGILLVLALAAPTPGAAEEPPAPAPPQPPAGTVQGFLVRSRDETPIAGARVALYGPWAQAIEARTEEDGWFLLPGVPSGTEFSLRAQAEGLPAVELAALRVPPEGTLDLDEIPAGKPSAISWRILDGRGRPVPGAVVEFRRRQTTAWASEFRSYWTARGPADAVAVSGADGAATLSAPPGLGVLEIRAEGLASRREWIEVRDGEDRGVRTVVLGRGFGFRGRLLAADGKPLAGARIETVDPSRGWLPAWDVTSEDGRFHFHGLRPGTYRSTAILPDGTFSDLATVLVPGARTVEFDLSSARWTGRDLRIQVGPVVSGRATDAEGRPVAHVLVSAVMLRGTGHCAAAPVRTDAEGNYRLPLPCKGLGFVEVRAPHHYPEGYPSDPYRYTLEKAPASSWVFDVSGGEDVRVHIPLKRGRTVEGFVTGPKGGRAQGAIAVVGRFGGGPPLGGRTAPTGADGRFQVREVGPEEGRVYAWARLPGGGEAKSEPVSLPEEENDALPNVAVTAQIPGVLEGKVATADPKELEEGELHLLSEERFRIRDKWTSPPIEEGRVVPVGPDGTFRTTAAHGEWRFVWAVRGCFLEAGPKVVVGTGSRREGIEVLAPAAPAIEGRVVDEDGWPVEAAVIRLRSTRENTVYGGFDPGWLGDLRSTDEAGRFRIDGLPGRHYEAEVIARNRATVRLKLSAGDPLVLIALPARP